MGEPTRRKGLSAMARKTPSVKKPSGGLVTSQRCRLGDESGHHRVMAAQSDADCAFMRSDVAAMSEAARLQDAKTTLAELLRRIGEQRVRLEAARARQRGGYPVIAGLAEVDAALADERPFFTLSAGEQLELQQFQRDKRKRQLPRLNELLEALDMGSAVELFEELAALSRATLASRRVIVTHGREIDAEVAFMEHILDELRGERDRNALREPQEVAAVSREIAEARPELDALLPPPFEEAECQGIFAEVERLFNALELPWDESPDGGHSVTRSTALWALDAICAKLREQPLTT